MFNPVVSIVVPRPDKARILRAISNDNHRRLTHADGLMTYKRAVPHQLGHSHITTRPRKKVSPAAKDESHTLDFAKPVDDRGGYLADWDRDNILPPPICASPSTPPFTYMIYRSTAT